ncbi:hypothetical protein EXIGLDRAFT_807779 [Exidia glandulosa HHB12029]|uniref:Uncharacterized protein n=1 Tax=Exidia glandulosa HHB12029 TaxID=1314781 RepID=A0A165LXE6_EXIGL|nr:hypothetical protein EXIGLDRAFT_807779 [Exidia glandulosa HHB12029]
MSKNMDTTEDHAPPPGENENDNENDQTVPPTTVDGRPIAGTKRVRAIRGSDASTTEDEVMRARALVRNKENNSRDSPGSDDGTPTALYKANYAPMPKVRLAPIKPGEFIPRAFLRDDLLFHNAAAPAWEAIAQHASENPNLGMVALAIPLGWKYSHDTAASMAESIKNTIQSVYQCKNVIVTAPQPHSPPRKPRVHGAPHAFLVQGLSVEVHKEATKQYLLCTRNKQDEVGAIAMHPWYMRPKEHVISLEGIYAIIEASPEVDAELTRYVREHIRSRKEAITRIITAHADEYGGDKFLFADWFDALTASVTAEAIVDPFIPNDRRRRRTHINVYAFGAFSDAFSCKEWARSLLGDKIALGRFGIATPVKNALSCSYCHEGDHHVRVCKVLQHEHWFHKPTPEPDTAAARDEDDDEGWEKPKGRKRGKGGKKPSARGKPGKR